jgi:hypothetical protein
MGRGAALRGAERGIGAVDSIIAEIMDIAAADKGTGVNGGKTAANADGVEAGGVGERIGVEGLDAVANNE